jgi:serine/threonine-protein kinase HipA
MTKELVALLGEHELGRVRQDQRGRLTLTYGERWRHAPDAHPLSLSMPLAATEHGHAVVDAFLWGLLPDNAHILDRWGRRFRVSARNAFALIAHVGEDCAGAVQFVRPDRLKTLLGSKSGAVQWLDTAAVAERLRALRADQSAWRRPGDTGQFSLAGAQPKTALLAQNGRWGVPSGSTPTTHILKPPTGELDGHVENEHFCLALARELGLPAAASEVTRFDDEIAIVVERYDRLRSRGAIVRVHQEDICQALGVSPTKKYENEGGPGVRRIAELLRSHSSAPDEDIATLLDSLALNWLIAGPDAHAKNYSILIGAAQTRLAPLYDLASVLPYPKLDLHKITLAMKLGGEYRLRAVGLRQWQRVAAELRLDPERVRSRVLELAGRIPDSAATVRRRAKASGLHHPVVDRLPDMLAKRAAQCAALLTAAPRSGPRGK